MKEFPSEGDIDMRKVKERIAQIETNFKERKKSVMEEESLSKIEVLKEEIKKLYQEGTNKGLFLDKVSQFQYLQKRAEYSPTNIGGTTSVVVYIENNKI